MLIRKIIVAASVFYLLGCGNTTDNFLGFGSSDLLSLNKVESRSNLEYSYPANEQILVTPSAPIILRYTSETDVADIQDGFQICEGEERLSREYDFSQTDDNKGVVIKSEKPWSLDQDHHIYISDSEIDCSSEGQPVFSFRTRPSEIGITTNNENNTKLKIIEMIPDGKNFMVIDFSSFRIVFNHHINRDTVLYGKTVKLLDEQGKLVPANIVALNNLITIDPCIKASTDASSMCGSESDKLDPNINYQIILENIKSLTLDEQGEPLILDTKKYDISPTSSGNTPQVLLSMANTGTPSLLSGGVINGVVIESIFLGKSDVSELDSQLIAELGSFNDFTGDTPLPIRVSRGSAIEGLALNIEMGGVVPILETDTNEQMTSGSLKIAMISDASGYMMKNPYTDDPNARRHIRLFMDLALTAGNNPINSVATQKILRAEFVGMAEIRNGQLEMSAFSAIELNLLGHDMAYSGLSLNLIAETGDLSDTIEQMATLRIDEPAPVLINWSPGLENGEPGLLQKMMRSGDPVWLFFDRVIEAHDSAQPLVTITGDGVEVDPSIVQARLEGSSIVVNLVGGFTPGVKYRVTLEDNIRSLGGKLASRQSVEFDMPASSQSNSKTRTSPLALTTYPGFPCVTDVNLGDVFPSDATIKANHGRCLVSPDSKFDEPVLPLSTMPTDRAIKVVFSQPMDLSSIELGESWLVEKIVDASGRTEPVHGRLRKSRHMVEFVPREPWEIDGIYRYTLRSAEAVDGSTANALCNSMVLGKVICSDVGYPLQTDVLIDAEDIGGPDLQIYFRGTQALKSSITQLRNYPVRDTNANLHIDGSEPSTMRMYEERQMLTSENSTLLTVADGEAKLTSPLLNIPIAARVGCSPRGEDCYEDKFLYQTYALNIEVRDPVFDPITQTEGVAVWLYPTLLITNSVVIHLNALGIIELESETGPQILRMPYYEPTADNPEGTVPGMLLTGEDGNVIFRTDPNVELLIDTPNLHLPLPILDHNMFGHPLPFVLDGKVKIYDDGKVNIEQWNKNTAPINTKITFTLADYDLVTVDIPLEIPVHGQFLNFVSPPVKNIVSEN